MKTNYEIVSGDYAVIDNELRFVNVGKIFIDGEDVRFFLKDADGKELGEFRNITLYRSVEAFEKGEVEKRKVSLVGEAELDDKGRLRTWKMENGEPSDLWMDGLSVKFGYPCEPVLPDGYYLTRAECLRNETWTERKEDGTTAEHEGVLKKIKLTKEQQEYVENVLKPALDGCKKAGINLVTDWNEVIYAYNARKIGDREEWSGEYDPIHSADKSEMAKVGAFVIVVGEDVVLTER